MTQAPSAFGSHENRGQHPAAPKSGKSFQSENRTPLFQHSHLGFPGSCSIGKPALNRHGIFNSGIILPVSFQQGLRKNKETFKKERGREKSLEPPKK